MTATVLSEGRHAGSFIVSEGDGWFSRDAMAVALSQTLAAGAVVGIVGVPASETSSVAADAGNTGNGTFTLDGTNPVASGAINGNYRVICVAAAANGGTFEVTDPKGTELGRVLVGATWNNQIKFSIADGSADFIVGDAFTVSVGRESDVDEQVVALNVSATDGSQNAAGIVVYPITTDGSNTGKVAVIRRHAEVRASDLTWPGGITATQKAAAIEQLRASGILVR